MDFTPFTPIVSFVAGALSATFTSWVQHRYTARAQRLDREAQANIKREERQEQLHQQQLERVRDLYRRTTQLGVEYQQFEGGDPARWREFISRFVAVKGELELDGSAEVRQAFKAYLDKVQAADHEAMYAHPDEDTSWQHHDHEFEQLTLVMRNDLAQRATSR